MMSSASRLVVSPARVLAFALAALAPSVRAQAPAVSPAFAPSNVAFVDAGSESDRYLRLLQLTGDVPLYPWSIRAFSPREGGVLERTPVAQLFVRRSLVRPSVAGFDWSILPVESAVIFNSQFPYGINDGAIWAGRGLTSAVRAGVAARRGPVSLQLEPVLFSAQNQAFEIRPTGRSGAGAFANGFSNVIDLPQRFGSSAYRRFDLGNSTLRVDAGWFAAALSTANQFWGPAIEHPIVLGDNAAGFPHAYVGTAHPMWVGVGSIHGRIVWGRLDQSASSPQQGPGSRRFMSGLVGVFLPRGLPGLELGVTRFFHSPWPDDGLLHAPFLKPIEAIYKRSLSRANNLSGTDTLDNQLASVFARWVFPEAGVEIYGEYGKEDHNQDARDFWQEPDHDSAYLLGLQRAWRRGATGRVTLRGELLDSRLSHLDAGRPQADWYVHDGGVRQGHTELGQALGSAGGFGGGAAVLALESVSPGSRWTVSTSRLMRAEKRERAASGLPASANADVLHTIGIEHAVEMSRAELTAGLTRVLDLNRDFERDVVGVNVVLGLTMRW